MPHICNCDWTRAYLSSSRWQQFIVSALNTCDVPLHKGSRSVKETKGTQLSAVDSAFTYFPTDQYYLFVCLSFMTTEQEHIRTTYQCLPGEPLHKQKWFMVTSFKACPEYCLVPTLGQSYRKYSSDTFGLCCRLSCSYIFDHLEQMHVKYNLSHSIILEAHSSHENNWALKLLPTWLTWL